MGRQKREDRRERKQREKREREREEERGRGGRISNKMEVEVEFPIFPLLSFLDKR
jgi:hypothetical protein